MIAVGGTKAGGYAVFKGEGIMGVCKFCFSFYFYFVLLLLGFRFLSYPLEWKLISKYRDIQHGKFLVNLCESKSLHTPLIAHVTSTKTPRYTPHKPTLVFSKTETK